jgi:DNA-binding transcriptional LysR family regulator
MTPAVIGLVLCAALLHATWNAMLRSRADQLWSVTVMSFSDSTAMVRRILAWPRVLAASRAYLDKAGAPLTPTDLARHAIILGPASLSGHWSFRKGDTATSLEVEGKLTIRASVGAIAAAVEGLGIVMTPLGACRRELERGELVRLLPEWDAGTVELNAVYASGRAAKPSARAFVDYLIAAPRETKHAVAHQMTASFSKWSRGFTTGAECDVRSC